MKPPQQQHTMISAYCLPHDPAAPLLTLTTPRRHYWKGARSGWLGVGADSRLNLWPQISNLTIESIQEFGRLPLAAKIVEVCGALNGQ